RNSKRNPQRNPSRMAAACGQKAPANAPTNALASARTFGAKHRRGLPPSRWFQTQSQTQSQPHGGSLRAKVPANVLPPPSPARAPSVRNIAGGSRPAAGSKRKLSRMAAACGQTAPASAIPAFPPVPRTFGA
ncbi:MAG: hypothetical protein ACKO2L_08415, partial [Planctomycetaceae bacterium]